MKTSSLPRTYFLLLAPLLAVFAPGSALAHQPSFEDPDTTAATPLVISDPEISTALFSTLEKPGDVDFFSFTVSAGQTIEIGMTIPQVEGQKQFPPTIAVIAREMDREASHVLPADALPLVSGQFGVSLMEPVEAEIFFEPFSRTAYWQRQRRRITFASEGDVHVVVWHQQLSVGRYTLVVGQREVLGGDPGFARKLNEYWTPVKLSPGDGTGVPHDSISDPTQEPAASTTETADSETTAGPCSWLFRLLASLIGAIKLCR